MMRASRNSTMSPRQTAIAAPKANFSPMPPPTATVIATVVRILPSAAIVRCWPPAPITPRRHAPSPAISWPMPASAPTPTACPLGQGNLHAPQGDGRAIICRCQAASQASLCPLPKSHPSRMPVPVGCGRPKHREDRNGPDKSAKTGHRKPQRPDFPPPESCSQKNPIRKKQNPPKYRRVCQQSEGGRLPPFLFLRP
ncbi:hypothetical protein J2W42_000031 [Rhizobium tibeticum]|nr:hypothetical protein [Rhizobium tibeticum]